MEEKIKEIIKMFDQAIELAKRRREFLISSNSEKVGTIEMLKRGIKILNGYREMALDGSIIEMKRKHKYSTLGLGKGFGEFDSGRELMEILHTIDTYYINM